MKSILSSVKQKVSMQEETILDFPPKVLYENSYCNQDNFSVLVCGGRNKSKIVVDIFYKLDGRELKSETFRGS